MKVETHLTRKIKFVREHWTEWLMFKVSGVYLAHKMPMPKYFGLIKVELDYYYLVFKPLIPFVVFARFLWMKWRDAGLWFYDKNLFASWVEEAEEWHWFWPIYFIPKRKKYDRGN